MNQSEEFPSKAKNVFWFIDIKGTNQMSSNTSIFDPNSFLTAQITEVSVKRPPITAGLEIIGVVTKVEMKTWQGKKDPTQSGIKADVSVEFDMTQDPNEMARIGGLAKLTLVDSIMLNLNDGGGIDMAPGKNTRLRQWREALDMNKAGEAFSFANMAGRLVGTKIKHEPYNDEIFDKIGELFRPR